MERDRISNEPVLELHLELHHFLRAERDAIIQDWEKLDRRALKSARHLSVEDQRDNIPTILDTIANHAQEALSAPTHKGITPEGAKSHAKQRWDLGFSLEDVTREYGMLRTVIMQKLSTHAGVLSNNELIFLYQSLDEAIIASVVTYVASANHALEDERERLEVTLKSIGDGVIRSDPEGNVNYLNPAAEEILGLSRSDALGRPLDDVLVTIEDKAQPSPERLARESADDHRSDETRSRSSQPRQILLQTAEGEYLPTEEIVAPLWSATGEYFGMVTTLRDVSKIRALTLQLGYLAAHDPLTGLPNRSLLVDRLSQELAHAQRDGSRVALLYLDLDLFKDVNDMLGHPAGDDLLKQVASRLQSCVRKADTVCRVGGDEFVILLSDFGALEYLNGLGTKIIDKIRIPYQLGTDTVDISTSIGVSVFPEDGRDPQTLIKHADIAMYQAKSRGRHQVRFFAPDMNKKAAERRALQGDLRKAVEEGQLSLHFQPQVALGDRKVIGAEVLLRWKHPVLGSVPPSRFIPVAEDNRGIMASLGNWVFEESCRQARSWLDSGHGPLRLSVNVSVAQLRRQDLAHFVQEVLDRHRLTPDYLQLELTESLLMSDVAGAMESVRTLEEMGLCIAIDDFGTGYSSLSYLKNLPVDELKIDQSFVRNAHLDNGDGPIVKAIIRMAQSLQLRVVAEGVENQEAEDFLVANGCESAQGFYYSKPVPAYTFEQRFLNTAPLQ